jgi:hypothetical protein
MLFLQNWVEKKCHDSFMEEMRYLPPPHWFQTIDEFHALFNRAKFKFGYTLENNDELEPSEGSRLYTRCLGYHVPF